MGIINLSNDRDIESSNLAVHVRLAEERSKAVDDRIGRIEDRLAEIADREKNNRAMILSTIGTVVASVIVQFGFPYIR